MSPRKINTKRTGNSGILKDGIYKLRIDDVEEKTSPSSGNDYIQLKLVVLFNGAPSGRSIWDVLSFSEGAQFKFDQLHDALNAPEDTEITMFWYKNKSVYAQLATDEYNGNLKNVVKMYLTEEVALDRLEKQGAASSSENGDGDISSFDDEPVTQTANVSAKAKRNKNAALVDDDDMPL